MNVNVEAVYENGVLRPVAPLTDIHEGQRVRVTVRPVDLDPTEYARRESALLQRMEAEGKIFHWPPYEGPQIPFRPIVIEGEPMSETVIKMRRGEA